MGGRKTESGKVWEADPGKRSRLGLRKCNQGGKGESVVRLFSGTVSSAWESRVQKTETNGVYECCPGQFEVSKSGKEPYGKMTKKDNLRNLWKPFKQIKEKRQCCFNTVGEWQHILLKMALVWRYLRDITG